MSKRKTKGTAGKSPFAVCVAAAAKSMAAGRHSSPKGKKKGSGAGSAGQDATAPADASGDSQVCTDDAGNVVSPESDAVVDCTDGTTDASAQDSSDDNSP
jgi:hypothetical protein